MFKSYKDGNLCKHIFWAPICGAKNYDAFMGKCPREELAFHDVRMMGSLIEIPVGARDHVPSSLTGGWGYSQSPS